MSPKTGTVTFLFTDIEGSTQLWEQNPEAMERALARHDEIIHGAVESHGGRVFKTAGDEFCCAFGTPEDAVAAALAAQRDLHAGPWEPDTEPRVRMALHTGPAHRRGGDYFGVALNRVARIVSCAHGGQTLLSEATHKLIKDRPPQEAGFRSLGEHRLRDLSRPERIYQLLHPDLPDDFPPLRSLPALAHNLPVQLTSFIGREREILEVRKLLQEARLLTLTGAGGAGKTRLVLQVAGELMDEHDDGVWLAALDSLVEPELVPHAIGSALGVREEPGRAISATLADHLRARDCLVILDNCEHLLAACASLVEELLRSCPALVLLATSREALGIPGERTYHVSSLSTPGAGEEATPDSIAAYESVRLFVDRAQGHQPAFEVTELNAPTIAQICRRLDGIPLAIELAAARVRAMSVGQIAARLDDRFRLLTGGSRTALPRQQTLQALIDWSYDLLSEQERVLFRRLSVFAGGWTLGAAEAVCSGDGIEERGVLDLLTRLVDKSVVLYETAGEQRRYRMLETIREYARDGLLESGEAAAVRDRHRGFFARLAEESTPGLSGPDQADWLHRFETEHDNLRAALDWCQETPEGTLPSLHLALTLSRFWCTRGYLSEGRQRTAEVLARAADAPRAARARVLIGAAWLAKHHGDYSAAQALFEEAADIERGSGQTRGLATCLDGLGHVASAQGDYATARALLEEALALNRELRDETFAAASLHTIGLVTCLQGDHAAARVPLEESLATWRELRNERRVAECLSTLGLVMLRDGDGAAARELQRESLTIRRDLGQTEGIAENLERLGELSAGHGSPAEAARLWGAAEALRGAIGAPLPPVLQDDHHRSVAAVRDVLGEEAFSVAWEEGRVMTEEEVVAYALGVTGA